MFLKSVFECTEYKFVYIYIYICMYNVCVHVYSEGHKYPYIIPNFMHLIVHFSAASHNSTGLQYEYGGCGSEKRIVY